MIVGPDSAGAVPGPVCYDTGGNEPTVTDASLILGHLNPEFLVGGALQLNAERARKIFAERIARPLGLSLEHAAYGAQRIASANMMRAIRAVSIERGRDPRDYTLCAFGGNGPVFACTHGEGARHAPRAGAALARPVLGLRPALRRGRAPLWRAASAACCAASISTT